MLRDVYFIYIFFVYFFFRYKIKRNIFPRGPDEDNGAVEQPSEIVDMPIEEYKI